MANCAMSVKIMKKNTKINSERLITKIRSALDLKIHSGMDRLELNLRSQFSSKHIGGEIDHQDKAYLKEETRHKTKHFIKRQLQRMNT